MFEINLLPPEMRQKRSGIDSFSLLILIGSGILLILMITGVILGWGIHSNYRKVKELTQKWEALQPTSLEVSNLKTTRETLDKKAKSIETLMANRLCWSRKLNQLSDLMYDGVWLKHLSISTRAEMLTVNVPPDKDEKEKKTAPKVERREYKVLVLRGNTMSLRRGEVILDLVGKFMGRLKKDEEFFQDFTNVEVSSIEREMLSDAEAMKFEITCRFK